MSFKVFRKLVKPKIGAVIFIDYEQECWLIGSTDASTLSEGDPIIYVGTDDVGDWTLLTKHGVVSVKDISGYVYNV